jgi:hypothetical protein
MGSCSAQKYRVKWTNLSEDLMCGYGANHLLFQDPSKEVPPKPRKFMVPSHYLSLDAAGSSPPVSNMADALECFSSFAEDSEPDHVVPQCSGISPLQKIGDIFWRMDELPFAGTVLWTREIHSQTKATNSSTFCPRNRTIGTGICRVIHAVCSVFETPTSGGRFVHTFSKVCISLQSVHLAEKLHTFLTFYRLSCALFADFFDVLHKCCTL